MDSNAYQLLEKFEIIAGSPGASDLTLSQDVSIITTKNAKYKQEKLKFACNLQSSNLWKSITTVVLSKNTSSGNYQDIVTVLLDMTGVIANWHNSTIWHLQSGWGNRADVKRAYVQPVTSSSGLDFEIPADRVECSDEGTYRCKITGVSTTSKALDKEKIDTVTLTVEPNRIDQITILTQNPQPELIYNANDLVTLSCNGEVGNPAKDLRWCYRNGGNNPPGNFQGWNKDDDINKGSFIPFGCQKTQTSTLRYNVSAEYPYREFKCETAYDNLPCGHSSIISSNITIFRYTSPAVNNQQSDDTASGGVIAGAVIGSFVGIILIVVIVYFVAFRKKNEGETYRTKEENGRTGSAPIDNTTVYSVPHKERHGDRDRCDENLISQHPPPPPHPHKQELHYAELDIASNPPGIPPPKPLKPKPKPRTKKGEPPTEYAVVKFV
ncbi:Hypothetical predicted protein [Mytilus galloprovincialis]|uniref:Ig-like domain-containing protein n=1 Tax=Mytilus galloprovincialis TaxID=29158 RepID=A0A8B6BVL7_MYTGA|nr:Hypothetical predicted protein [Mytilus galloprovincialis]